jgi:hypothetical protein
MFSVQQIANAAPVAAHNSKRRFLVGMCRHCCRRANCTPSLLCTKHMDGVEQLGVACAAIYHDFIVSLQKLSLLICILLLRLDCMVGHLRETQCPADSMLCLQYLHCQKESTVWTQGACQPMCNILCNCTFALQACWVACHTQRYGQTALLLDEFNTGENLLWCQSSQQVSTACHAAIVML